jgi:hypothetical protein
MWVIFPELYDNDPNRSATLCLLPANTLIIANRYALSHFEIFRAHQATYYDQLIPFSKPLLRHPRVRSDLSEMIGTLPAISVRSSSGGHGTR